MSEIIIFEPIEGGKVRVRLEDESLWLTQEQIAALFKRERSVITKHLRNIFRDEELDEKSNVKNLHVAGSDKPVKSYNSELHAVVNPLSSAGHPSRHDRLGATGVLEEVAI